MSTSTIWEISDHNLSKTEDILTETSTTGEPWNPTTQGMGTNIPPNWSLIVLLLIPVTAVVSNSLVCVAVKKHLPLQTSTFYMLSSLAVVDVFRAILIGAPLVMRSVTGTFSLGMEVCITWVDLDTVLNAVVIFHLFLVTFDWYKAIKEPLKYKLNASMRKVWMSLFAVWLLAILLSIPVIVLMKIDTPIKSVQFQECGPVNIKHGFVKVITTFCVPVIISAYMFILASKAVKSSSKQVEEVNRYAQGLRSANGMISVSTSNGDIERGAPNHVLCPPNHHGIIKGNGKHRSGKEQLNEPLVDDVSENLEGIDNPGFKDGGSLPLCDSIRRGHPSFTRQQGIIETDVGKNPDDISNTNTENEEYQSKDHNKCNDTRSAETSNGLDEVKAHMPSDDENNEQKNQNVSNEIEQNTTEILNKTNEEDKSNKVSNPEDQASSLGIQTMAKNKTVDHIINGKKGKYNSEKGSNDKLDSLENNGKNHNNNEKLTDQAEDKEELEAQVTEVREDSQISELSCSEETKDTQFDKTNIINRDINETCSNNSSTNTHNIEHEDNSPNQPAENEEKNNITSDNETDSVISSGSKPKRKKSVRFKSSDGKIIEPAETNGTIRGFTQKMGIKRLSDIGENPETLINSIQFNHIKLDLQVGQYLSSDPREYIAQVNHAQSLRMLLRLERHIKLLKILLTVFIVYICMSLPHQVLVTVLAFCSSCQNSISETTYTALNWLAFSTCAVNPFIYSLLEPKFRKAFAYSCEDDDIL